MATYNAIKYNVNYKGFAVALVPLFSTSFTSATGTVQITSGITSAFDEYLFIFNDIRPATDNRGLTFRGSTDGGSSYGIDTTTSVFRSAASEGGGNGVFNYNTEQELIDTCNSEGLSFSNISDVLNFFTDDEIGWTEEQAKTHLRDSFPNVTDWSF